MIRTRGHRRNANVRDWRRDIEFKNDKRQTKLRNFCWGGGRERIRKTKAENFNFSDVDPLDVVGVDVVVGFDARPIPFDFGLPDS